VSHRPTPPAILGVVVGLAAEARRLPRDPRVRTAVADADPREAYRAASALAGQGISVLASVGVAAGLRADLRTGDVVIGTDVVTAAGEAVGSPCDAVLVDRLRRRLPDARVGRIATVETPVTSPAAKARLAARTAALAVDMESGAVLRAATEAGLPAVVLRVVLDPADRAIPAAALAGGPGGGSPAAVAAALARRPWELPGLLRLARDYGRALARLRDVAPSVTELLDGPSVG